jgi:hypothetical protein
MEIDKLKVGDFIKGSYKFGCVCGVVSKIKKSIVVIKICKPYYNEYTLTEHLLNVTKDRIHTVGLNENEKII